MMENEFQIYMMRELTFFLGIQVKQTKEVIFIHQTKYMKDLMKKFNVAISSGRKMPVVAVASHLWPCSHFIK
jgi:hypothetical protein